MSNIDQFVAGYQRFHDNYFVGDEPLFAELSQGQSPSTMIIACSDSRVDPAIVMDAKPGDLFVVRNVANLVPPYEKGGGYHGVSAALEFGVCGLNVRHIMVMGHRQCGGIKALAQGVPEGLDGEFVRPWMSIASRAHERVLAEHPHASESEVACACELAGIIVSLENLVTFPFIKSRLDDGTLTLHGWYFDIETGVMSVYDPETLSFKKLD
ncbi:MAG: carbonic anhydrase [Methylophilaceae bacterium]